MVNWKVVLHKLHQYSFRWLTWTEFLVLSPRCEAGKCGHCFANLHARMIRLTVRFARNQKNHSIEQHSQDTGTCYFGLDRTTPPYPNKVKSNIFSCRRRVLRPILTIPVVPDGKATLEAMLLQLCALHAPRKTSEIISGSTLRRA